MSARRLPLPLAVAAGLFGLLVGTSLANARPPAPLPGVDGAKTHLRMKVVRYSGGVNGEMVVEVENRGPRTEVFDPQGLYFVPDGDPDKAPQRLGAAGPFQIEGKASARPLERLPLAPRAKAQVRLQVFCIDSHRASPSAQTPYHMAAQRLPRDLRREIVGKAKAALHRYGGRMPAAKAAIQTEVWTARDRAWIKLDGERKREKTPHEQRHAPHRYRRHPLPLEQRQAPPPPAQPAPRR